MANNNIEQYLEAMLAALDGDTVPDVPSPSWNIEKYLAAILTKLSSGSSGGGGDVVVAHITRESGENGQYVCDMTQDEIESAINDGKTVLCQLYSCISVFGTDSSHVNFVVISAMGNTLTYIDVLFRDDGITVVPTNYTLTPAS